MIDTQALKKKVLSAAIKGELTSKPSEYERWEWKPLGQIARIYNGRAYKQAELLKNKDGNTPVLRVGNLFTNNDWYYSDLQLEENKYCDNGDLIYAWSASFGPFIWDGGKAIYHYHIWKIEHDERIDRRFLYYFLMSDTQELKEAAHGVAMVHVTKARMEKTMVPLPTLQAQKLIVKKIDDAFEQLDMIEMLQLQYSNNIASLNNKILDLAIRGKLVPQDPNDEPASVLLKKIAEKKQKLIKEGKVSKSRTRYDFEDSDIPFDIPDTWDWARLGDICFDLKYGTSSKSSKTGEIIVIRMGNIQNGEIDYTDRVYSSSEIDNEKYALKPLDILFNRTNSNELVGKTGIYRGQHKAIFAGYLVLIRPIEMNPEYINYVMNSTYEKSYCCAVKSDSVNQANVNATKIGQFLIPIPPRKEQDRIVEKIKKTLDAIRHIC